MDLLKYFRDSQPPKGSARVAKERLRILVERDRSGRNQNQPSYLPDLEREILAVIQKYVDVDPTDVIVHYEQEESQEILELNIILPEGASETGQVGGVP